MMMMMKFMSIFLLCFFIHTQTSNANVASVDATQMNMPYNPLVELRKQYVPPEIAIFDWVRSHGGIVDGVAIFSPKNKPRGLYTTKQFKNGTMLLSIPNEVMIHRGFVLNEKKNPAFVSYYRGHIQHAAFPGDDCALNALYIMFEMFYNRRNTIIGPYLDLLPKFDTNFQYFNYLPSFWSTEIKNLFNTLPSSRFEFYKREQQLVAIERYIGEILYPYTSKEYIVENADVLYSQYRWAMSIVQSRAWGALTEKEGMQDDVVPPATPLVGNCTVVPLADMLNHRTEAMALSGVRDTIDGKSYFIGHGLQAIKDMDAGEEIFDNYSPLSETHLCTINILITFGFLEPERGYDCYEFTVNATFDGESKFVAEKIALFNAFGIPRTLSVTLRGSTLDSMRERFPEDYLIFMRIMSISNINQYKTGMIVANGIKAGTHSRKTVWSLDNEHNTLRSIKKQASNIQLYNFETTVEEDLEILQLLDSKLNDSSITSYKTLESYRQQKLIVGLRRREHEVVSTLIDFADEKWMNLLNAKILNSDI